MTERNAKQMKAHYIEKMGADLGMQFDLLMTQCHWLHVKWEVYNDLYGTNPDRIDLLNQAAAAFFWVIQETLWDDILLHISRLTDDIRVGGGGGRETLTIQRLPDLVNAELKPELDPLIKDAIASATAARDHRHRALAHHDLRLSLNQSVKPLEPLSRASLREAISAITKALKLVDSHYCNVDPMYFPPSVLGTAEQLLYVIRDGIEARQALIEQLKAGDIKNLKPPRPI